jgi:homoserine dehydrogenase
VSEAPSNPNSHSTQPERRRPHGGRPIRVGLLGAGVVGGGVLALLAQHARQIEQRVGVRVEVGRALVRDLGKPRVPEAAGVPFTTDAEELFGDASLDLFVEVMGGTDEAGTLLARALSSGRSVVTANKALLAARGAGLFALAAANRADLAFEAAVGGGIPIIRTLRDAASSDEVVGITGILNGTSNFILTAMTDSRAPFAEALADAQARGFAEADPSLDVGGFDAAQKLLVLAMLAFGQEPVPLSHDPSSAVLVEGITAIDAADVEAADRLGFVVKHLVVGRDHGERVELRAHPALVRKLSAWAAVAGSLNAVKIEGRALGPLFMSGRGAGDLPTAVSVVADVVEVARSIVAGVPGLSTGLATGARAVAVRPLVPRADLELRYYVRFEVHDQPGVLARIAGALAEHRVSIAEIVQSEGKEGRARIVLTTHRAREGAMLASLAELAPISVAAPVLLRIEDTL